MINRRTIHFLSPYHHHGTDSVMAPPRTARDTDAAIARTIRFPRRLRERIAADAERCGRSFEAHVIAVLRRHYGEDVDIAPAPSVITARARASLSGLGRAERRMLTRHLVEGDGG